MAWIYKIAYFFLFLICLLLTLIRFIPFPNSWLQPVAYPSIKVIDRHGEVLRETLSAEGGRREFLTVREVSPDFIEAVLLVEDRRFLYHMGIDPLAVLRALSSNLYASKIVSGGSTITQQVARNLFPGQRSLSQKIKEAVIAVWLDAALTKKDILELYINNAPFSNELYGVQSASSRYFKKHAKDLSLAQSIFLVGLVQSPSKLNPYLYFHKALRRQQFILKKMILHETNPLRFELALDEKIMIYPRDEKFQAPHFVDYVLNQPNLPQLVETSIDLSKQKKVERIVQKQLAQLTQNYVTQASVIVLDTQSAEILTWVGSAYYWDNQLQGMNNGPLMYRQPGSALKPFTYALALEQGLSPASVLPDVPTRFETLKGDYEPQNYDRKFRGPVRLRVALASSLNIPALHVARFIGVSSLYQFLKKMKFNGLNEDAHYYGLGLTLGNGEVSLLELVQAYSMLGRGGCFVESQFLMSSQVNDQELCQTPLLSERTLFYLQDILSDPYARSLAFGLYGPLRFDYPVMTKTGTSSHFRDNWAFGVTPEYTVGVWMGNFNGHPMEHVSGVSGSAPLMHEVMELFQNDQPPHWPKRPSGLMKKDICPLSGMPLSKACPNKISDYTSLDSKQLCSFHEFTPLDSRNGLLVNSSCQVPHPLSQVTVNYPREYQQWVYTYHIHQKPRRLSPFCESDHGSNPYSQKWEISFPKNGDVFRMDSQIPDEFESIVLRMTGSNDAMTKNRWYLNHQLIAQDTDTYQLFLGEGRFDLQIQVGGETKSVTFTIR